MNKVDYFECFKKPGNVVALFGKSGSGKTTTLKHIINETKDTFSHIFIYQGSRPAEDNLYIDVTWPDDISVVQFDNDLKNTVESKKKEIDSIIECVTSANNDIRDSNKKNPEEPQRKLMHILIILDDLTKLTNKFSDYLGKLRHSPVTMILLLHSATDIDKRFRSSVTFFIIHINFELNQIADVSPKLKEDFYLLRDKKKDNPRLFFVFDIDSSISYYSLVEEDDLEKLKTPSVYTRSSKQRDSLIKLLKALVPKKLKSVPEKP